MKERKKAAALRYEDGYVAPAVTAFGMGRIAENIVDKARETDVPIVYDEELTELISNVDIGDSIPFELYDAVAKVLAYVMDMDETVNGK